jgi:hypothetical protein
MPPAVLLVACAEGPAFEAAAGRWSGPGDRDLRFDVGSVLVASVDELRLHSAGSARSAMKRNFSTFYISTSATIAALAFTGLSVARN